MTTLAEALIQDFENDSKRTRAVLAAVPEAKFAWRPHAKSMTLGALAGHVAEALAWTESMVKEDLDMAAMAGWKPFAPTSQVDLLERFDTSCAAFRKALAGKSDDHMRGMWRMTMGPTVLMEQPRYAVIRDFSIHHGIHHRGQLTVYLRLLDVPVPSTFGPTADDNPMAGML